MGICTILPGRFTLCITTLLILLISGTAFAGGKSGDKPKKFKKGRILVKTRSGLPDAEFEKVLRAKRSRRGKKRLRL